MKKEIKDIQLNIGCGGRPLAGYINIDMDDLKILKLRYPEREFPKGIKIFNFNIFKLPFPNNSVAKIKADSLIEHLSFKEESKFFYEIKRVLKPGGIFHFSTTDFEKIVKLWIKAKDDWKDFYDDSKKAIAQNHWFGTYSHGFENRWGYLCASIFGNQKGKGQFHKNCYSTKKIRAILKHLEFKEIKISYYLWKKKYDPMIDVVAKKS